jgi:hypothetical protein
MTTQDDLHNALWEYVYGLLEPAEAAALEERITSDQDVARAYCEVRQQADRIAAATRVNAEPVKLVPPTDAPTDAPADVRPAERVKPAAAPLSLRGAQWLVGLAAAALVVFAVFAGRQAAWLRDPATLAKVETKLRGQHARIVVAGPAEMRPAGTNLFTILATDLDNEPLRTEVMYSVVSDQDESPTQTAWTDANGRTDIPIDGGLIGEQAQLEFWSPENAEKTKVTAHVTAAAPRYDSYLFADQPQYQAG